MSAPSLGCMSFESSSQASTPRRGGLTFKPPLRGEVSTLSTPQPAPRRDVSLWSTPPCLERWSTRSPPYTPPFQQHKIDPAGSILAERRCRTAAAKLEKGKRYYAAKLGASDPYVECIR